MNKKKYKINIISLLIAIIIIIAISIAIYFLVFKEEYETEKKVDTFGQIAGVWKEKPSYEDRQKRIYNIEKKIKNKEDIIESTVIEDDYMEVYIDANNKVEKYYLGYKGDKSIDLIIKGISNIIGYEMSIKNVSIGSKSIKIDFNKNSPPFDLSVKLSSDYIQNIELQEKKDVIKCVFNSIYRTIEANYGKNIKVYYSVDGQNIVFNDIEPKIEINKDKKFELINQ